MVLRQLAEAIIAQQIGGTIGDLANQEPRLE